MAQLKRKINGMPVFLVHLSAPAAPRAANDNVLKVWNTIIHSRKDKAAPERWLLAQWGRRLMDRRDLRRLLDEQPDTVLADAGLTRPDAEREARKPFWIA